MRPVYQLVHRRRIHIHKTQARIRLTQTALIGLQYDISLFLAANIALHQRGFVPRRHGDVFLRAHVHIPRRAHGLDRQVLVAVLVNRDVAHRRCRQRARQVSQQRGCRVQVVNIHRASNVAARPQVQIIRLYAACALRRGKTAQTGDHYVLRRVDAVYGQIRIADRPVLQSASLQINRAAVRCRVCPRICGYQIALCAGLNAHAIFVLNGDGIISPGHTQRIRQCQRLQVGIVVIRTAQFANLYSLDICPLRPDIRARVQGNCMAQHVGILPRIHDAGLGVNFALLYRVQDFVQIPILVILIGRVQLVGIRNLVKRCLLHRLQFTGHSGQHAHRR